MPNDEVRAAIERAHGLAVMPGSLEDCAELFHRLAGEKAVCRMMEAAGAEVVRSASMFMPEPGEAMSAALKALAKECET